YVAKTRIETGQHGRDHHGRADQSCEGSKAGCEAAKVRTEHEREIDDVGTGQDVTQRERLVEFPPPSSSGAGRRCCAMPSPAHRQNRQATFWQRRETARAGWAADLALTVPALGREPARNRGTWPKI